MHEFFRQARHRGRKITISLTGLNCAWIFHYYATCDTISKTEVETDMPEVPPPKTDGGTWLTPLNAAIFAGFITAVGTIFNSYVQSRSTLQLEGLKEQHELILKMISFGDPNQANLSQAKENLRFLVETSLITDPEQAKKILDAKATPVLPRASPGALLGGPNGTPCGPNMIMQDGACVSK
jgi:hypothetical protein